MCADRDRVVLAKFTVLKYAHVLLCATQCEPVNAQSCVCGAGIFLPLISRVAGPGRRLPRLDKDAVYEPLLGALWRPASIGLTHHGTERGERLRGYIYKHVNPVQPAGGGRRGRRR